MKDEVVRTCALSSVWLADFFGHARPDSPFTRTVSQSNRGSGRLNITAALQGRANCFQQVASGAMKSDRMKLIWCNNILHNRAADYLEMQAIHALVKNYDIYLWTQEKTLTTPLTTTAQFWQQRATAIPATEEDVKKALFLQAISFKECIILDRFNYCKLIEQAINSISKRCENTNMQDWTKTIHAENSSRLIPTSLNLSLMTSKDFEDPEWKARLLQGVNFDQITSIRIFHTKLTIDELNSIINAFPTIKMYVLEYTTDAYLKRDLAKFSHCTTLIIDRSTYNQITFPENMQLLAVHFQNCTSANKEGKITVNARKLQTLQVFSVKHCKPGTVVVLDYEHTKLKVYYVSINNALQFCGDDNLAIRNKMQNFYQKKPNLHKKYAVKGIKGKISFINDESPFPYINIDDQNYNVVSQLPTPPNQYENLTVDLTSNAATAAFQYANFSNITYLHLISFKASYDLAQHPHIVELEVSKSITIENINQCRKLEILRITTRELPNKLDCDIKQLTLTNSGETIFDLTGNVLDNCINLKKLMLIGNFKCDFTKFPLLERVTNDLKSPNQANLRLILAHLQEALSHCENIIYLDINIPEHHRENLTFNIDSAKSLEDFRCNISNINLKNAPQLRSICATNNNTTLNISQCPAVSTLQFSNKQVILTYTPLEHLTTVWIGKSYLRGNLNNIRAAGFINFNLLFTASPAEAALLSQSNHINPVSIFSLTPNGSSLDSSTGPIKNSFIAKGNMSVTFSSPGEVNKALYEINILDACMYLSNTKSIHFVKLAAESQKLTPCNVTINAFNPNDKNMIATFLRTQLAKNKDVGHFTGDKLTANLLIPLPSIQPVGNHADDLIIFCNHPDAITIVHNKDHQQYEFKIKPNVNVEKLELLYALKRNPSYEKWPTLKLKIAKDQNLLSTEFRDELIHQIQTNKELNAVIGFLLDDTQPLEKRIHDLKVLFSRMKTKDLDVVCNNQLEILYAISIEECGVCRHRSEAFMVYCHLLNVLTQMVKNEQHQYCRILFETADGGTQLCRIDLGGAARMDATPLEMRRNIFATLNESKEEKVPATNIIKKPDNPYFLKIKREQQENILRSIIPAIKYSLAQPDNARAMPLILLSNKNLANTLFLQIKKELSQYKTLYIDSPVDFISYFNQFSAQDGKRIRKDGELRTIINQEDVLFINWCTFSAEEIMSYKSILDTPPTFSGIPVSNKLIVINAIQFNPNTKGDVVYEVLSSRCKAWTLNPNYFAEQKSAENPMNENALKFKIDLLGLISWEDDLCGNITLDQDKIFFEDGILGKAIKAAETQEVNLIIKNAPDKNDAFTAFLFRLQKDRRILLNGILVDVPLNLNIVLKSEKPIINLPNIITVRPAVAHEDTRGLAYLGCYNFYDCFKQLVVTTDTRTGKQTAKRTPGLLNNYQKFYVTESLSAIEWTALMARIAENEIYRAKNYDFVLAPGVKIETVSNNIAEPQTPVQIKFAELAQTNTTFYVSNDPDFLTSQIMQKHKQSLVKHISAETAFYDLISEVKINTSADSTLSFQYNEYDVLAALRAGRTVILNGEMSYTLYQQLLPLLTDAEHIHNNGEEFKLNRGKLICVIPTSASKDFNLTPHVKCDFDFSDYKKMFPHHVDKIEQIERFYFFANLLPHIGTGRPGKPLLSYQRLQNMVDALLQPQLHLQNPIKSFFLYEYPKISDDYAFLNIAGKMLFQPQNPKKVRLIKLRKLIKILKIRTANDLIKHLWKLLNCFSGADLVTLLGKDLNSCLTKEGNFPVLRAEYLDRCVLKIRELLKEKPREEKQLPKAMKVLNSVTTALKSHALIFLKGDPGTGKTHCARQFKNKDVPFYEGSDSIIAWLDKPGILLLDEMSLAATGAWNFLKGMTLHTGNNSDSKKIVYANKEYVITPKHKIIATGNFNRKADAFLQSHALTILVPQKDEDELIGLGIKPILDKFAAFDQNVANILYRTFMLYNQYQPLLTLSIRDLQDAAWRYVISVTQDKQSTPVALWLACLNSFSGVLDDPKIRANFIADLKKAFPAMELSDQSNLSALVSHNKIEKHPERLISSFKQMFSMRQYALQHPNEPMAVKQGMLLIGNPGLGKSTFYITALESLGFRQDAEDTTKKFFIINPGTHNIKEIIDAAFQSGSVIIYDEINWRIDPEVKKALLQYLTGKDLKNQMPQKPGFRLLASQNVAGTMLKSEDLNRLNIHFVDEPTRAQLIELAAEMSKEPDVLVDGFLEARVPFGLTTRFFYKDLRKHAQLLPDPNFPAVVTDTAHPAPPAAALAAPARPNKRHQAAAAAAGSSGDQDQPAAKRQKTRRG